MSDLSYYCFSTPQNYYMYVRNINSIVRIKEEEFQELLNVKRAGNIDSPVVKKYKELGIFIDNPVKIIEHPNTEILGFQAKYLCQQLTLQVTQQCNLRCEYCAYSGLYENRTHANKNMDFDTAKKAIDFFLNHSRDSKQITFGFYGGEPLLMFKLIKQCVDYIERSVEGKEIMYAITTNGTLLSDEIVDFLAQHHVLLSISLDGSRKEHDLHRKFRSGEGSFDVIMENVRRLKERYPEYGKEVGFLPVVTPNARLEHVLKYFATDELLKDNHVNYYLGVIKERRGDQTAAEAYFEKASVGTDEPAGMMYYNDQPADMIYYQGLAREKLNRPVEAKARFNKLLDYGEQHIFDVMRVSYFAVSLPDFLIFDDDLNKRNQAHCYYLIGLANLGLGNMDAAAKAFVNAIGLEPTHQNAIRYLHMTGKA